MRIRIQRGAALWEREWPDVEITNGDTLGERERQIKKEKEQEKGDVGRTGIDDRLLQGWRDP
jgi:hypothetical protein